MRAEFMTIESPKRWVHVPYFARSCVYSFFYIRRIPFGIHGVFLLKFVFFRWMSFFSAHKFTFTRETLCKNSLILSFIVLMIFFIYVLFFLARSHRNDCVCRFFFVRLNDLSNTGIRDILKSFLWSRKLFRITILLWMGSERKEHFA